MATVPAPNLSSIITNETARKAIYTVYLVLLFLAGAAQAGFSTAGVEEPVWLFTAIGVLTYAGAAIAGLALANAGTPSIVVDSRTTTNAVTTEIEVITNSERDAAARHERSDGDGLGGV